MDKLDTETWEDYAFRNNLFLVKYSDNEKKIVSDVCIPIHTNITECNYHPDIVKSYLYKINILGNASCDIGFMDFIVYELVKLKDKYGLKDVTTVIPKGDKATNEREDDIDRQDWLYCQLSYWDTKYETKKENENKILVDKQKRYFELKTKISEGCREQLDELLTIVKSVTIPVLEGEQKSVLYTEEYWRKRENDETRKTKWADDKRPYVQKMETSKRVDLHETYFKNKNLSIQISDLEQKISILKSELTNNR